MAESEVRILPAARKASTAKNDSDKKDRGAKDVLARRWNDYGIALLEQAQYGPAAEAFRHAAELNPSDLNPLVSAAIAEMKTERFGPERNQLSKAAELLEAALKLNPLNPRARFIHALLLRSQHKHIQAADEL